MQDNQDRREKKESKMRRMLRSGCIAEFYTLSGYFVKVYPCFPIDKVKFAFVEKGKKGAPRNPSQPRCMRMRSGKTGNV